MNLLSKGTILTLTDKKFSDLRGLLVNQVHEFRAFVSICVEASLMNDVVEALSKIDAVEELREVTGEFDIVTVVSASDIESFRDILKNRIMKINGVKSTVTSIVLGARKGPKCET
jgi:DNA-binding Lrp family transcriptional regulator